MNSNSKLNTFGTLILSTALACSTKPAEVPKSIEPQGKAAVIQPNPDALAEKKAIRAALAEKARTCLAILNQQICVATPEGETEQLCINPEGVHLGDSESTTPFDQLENEELELLLQTFEPRAKLAIELRKLSKCLLEKYGSKVKFNFKTDQTEGQVQAVEESIPSCPGKIILLQSEWLQYLGCDNGISDGLKMTYDAPLKFGNDDPWAILSKIAGEATEACEKIQVNNN